MGIFQMANVNPMLTESDPLLQFRALWESGGCPDVFAFVESRPALGRDQMGSILRFDLKYRIKSEHEFRCEWYLERFPWLYSEPEIAVDLIFSEYLEREIDGVPPDADEYANRFPRFQREVREQIGFHESLARWAENEWSDSNSAPVEPVTGETQVDQATLSSLSPASAADGSTGELAGLSLPPYQIGEVIGCGGMGVVFRAVDLSLNRAVAIKFLNAGIFASAEHRRRFRDEAKAAARLRHPNIVQIFQFGEQQGQPFLALEFVGGGTLAAHSGRPQPARPAARLIGKLAAAMQYAHDHGVVHRDLKPANVLLSENSTSDHAGIADELASDIEPMITDFGLARISADDSLPDVVEATQTGQVLGTPSFMAPEQIDPDRGAIGPAVDVYALGAILFTLLTGRPPFLSATPIKTIQQVLFDAPVAPSRLASDIPVDLQTICLKCLEKDWGNRYATAQLLAEDLNRFLAGRPILARPAGLLERGIRWARRNRLVASLAASLLVVCLVAGIATSSLTGRANRLGIESKQNFDQAKQNLALVLDTVDRFCLTVSEDQRLHRPEFITLRRQLLKMATDFNQQYVNLPGISADAKLQLAKVYMRLGILGSGSETLAEAENHLSRARELLLRLHDEYPDGHTIALELARCERGLGKLRIQMADFESAEQHLQTSLELAARGESVPEFASLASFEKARSLAVLSRLYFKSQRRDEAESPLLESLRLLESLQETSPAEKNLTIERANNFSDLGLLYISLIQHWKKAEEPFDRAVRLYGQALESEPDSHALAAGFATVLSHQAKWYYMANNRQRAVTIERQARDLLMKLVDEHGNLFAYQTQLAIVLKNLASYLRRLDDSDPEIISSLERSETILAQQVARDPDDTVSRASLATSITLHADVLAADNQPLAALHKLELAIPLLDEILAASPQNLFACEQRYVAAVSRAERLTALEKFDAALTEWDDAIARASAAFEPTNRLQRARTQVLSGDVDGGTAAAESVLARLDANDKGLQHPYSVAAQTFALAAESAWSNQSDSNPALDGQNSPGEAFARRAIEMLRQRNQAAPPDLDWLETCPDFDSLRTRPDFVEVLKAARNSGDKKTD